MWMLAEWISEEEYELDLTCSYERGDLSVATFGATEYWSTFKSSLLDMCPCRGGRHKACGLKNIFVLEDEGNEFCFLPIMCYECYLHDSSLCRANF